MLSEPVGGEPQLKLAAGFVHKELSPLPFVPQGRGFSLREEKNLVRNRPPVQLHRLKAMVRSKINLASTTVFTFFNNDPKPRVCG